MTNYRQTMADALEFMYMMREYKLTERELTDDEKKRREEIAQDMDDTDFKTRYGDRWKEVKMAVATKQAKNESVEEVDLDEKTKWKMGDGRPRGGSHIENVRFWDLSKDKLQYIMKDAGEAMKANPTGRKASSGPGNYTDQVNDASTVLGWRKKNGIKEDVELGEGPMDGFLRLTFKSPADVKKAMKVSDTEFGYRHFSMDKARTRPELDIEGDRKDLQRLKDALKSAGIKFKIDLEEEVDLDEAQPAFAVKYAKSKGAPIKVTRFLTLVQAKEFLAKVKKDGMNGIISKGGKPVKEEVDLEEKYRVTNKDFGVWTGDARSEKEAKEKAMRKWGVRKSGSASVFFMRNTEIVKEGTKEEVNLDEEWKVGDKAFYFGKRVKITKVYPKGGYQIDGKTNVSGNELSIKEEVELDEDNMDLMRKAAKGAAQTLKMKDGKLKMDSFTASGIMQVYDKISFKNKMAMVGLINTGSKSNIMKLQAIAMKSSKGARREDVGLDEGKMKDAMMAAQDMIDDGASDKEIMKATKLSSKDVKFVRKNYGDNPGEYDESARSDAMRAIRKDKDLGKRSDVEDDDSASDVDIKGASKNIIMQMRKATSMRGNFKVEFEDKKKIKIPEKIAQAVQNKYNSFRKSADKEKFQTKVAMSYKSMLSALKENTILGRIGKKIQERKEILEASNRWELGGKKFSLINDKGTYILVTQGTGKEQKLKAKTPQDATQELVKKGYRES